MANKKIKVSVITPYYKGINTIFKTIDSVYEAAQLAGFIELDYLVVIDSMEDKEESFQKINKYYGNKVRIIKNDINIGVAASRNKALKVVRADYILFLDQDDLIDKNYFVVSEKLIKENSDLIVCNAYVVNTRNNKKVKMYNKKPNLTFNDFLKGNKILTPGQVLFSGKITEINNLYKGCSDEFKGADDWAAYLNIFTIWENIKIVYQENPVFYYNLHENNYSNNWKELNLSAIKTAEYFLDKVNEERKEILKNRINFLYFENEFKDKDYKIKFSDLWKVKSYYSYDLFDYNKIVHFLNKKIINFNK